MAIWKSIKTLTELKKNVKTANHLEVDDRIIDNVEEMADQFNSYFTTVAEKLRSQLSNTPCDLSKLFSFVKSRKDPEVQFSIPAITSSQIGRIILKISPNKTSGIDKISARFLRMAAPAISDSLAKIINLSFTQGKFPSGWKIAKVTPIYKSGTESDPSNYRPISVLPVVSKIIERHMHDSLYAYLINHNLIYSRQSGFRKWHSSETALIKIIDYLLLNLHKNQLSGMVLVDYRKAFDMVDHTLLLEKLRLYGIAKQELQWCQSYLYKRKQVVHLSGAKFSEALVKHGIPVVS